MKKNYPKKHLFLIPFCFLSFFKGFSQLYPVMGAIKGSSVVCSHPASPKTYSTSASNSPSSFAWSVIGQYSSGVIISNPSGAVTTISFPYSGANTTYTVYCTASNAGGSSPNPASFVVRGLFN
jgi:hypothetical protein